MRRTVHVSALPGRSDSAGVLRFANAVLALCAGSGVMGALTDRRLSRRRRWLAGATYAVVTAATTREARTPSWSGRALFERPESVLAVGAAGVLAAPAFGTRFNAMHMYPIASVGLSSAVLRQKQALVVAALTSLYWLAAAARNVQSVRELRRDDKAAMTFAVVPLSFAGVAWLTPPILRAARELDLLAEKLARGDASVPYTEHVEWLGRALGGVRLALERAWRDLPAITDPLRQERARDMLLSTAGRLDEHASVVTVAGQRRRDLEPLLRTRAMVIEDLLGTEALRGARIRVDVQPRDAVIGDSRVLTVLALTTATAISNALRYGRDVSEVRVSARADDERVQLEVVNDGESVEETSDDAGRGLRHLKSRAKTLQGTLDWGTHPGGGWRTVLDIPRRTHAAPGTSLTSERVLYAVDDAFRWMTYAMSAAVASMALEGHQLEARTRNRSRVAAAVTLALFHAGERGWRQELGPAAGGPGPWSRAVVNATIAVSWLSPHHEHSLWSGWANAVLSRYGLACGRGELAWLSTAHAAAILASYRGDLRGALVMASHQVSLVLLGPAMVLIAVSRARRALADRERLLQQRLAETEQLHELSESLAAAHPALQGLDNLLHDFSDIPPARDAIDTARSGLRRALRSRPAPLNAAAFADEFADTVASRIWPAEVLLERDDGELRRMNARVTASTDFRREGLEIADRLGDHLVETYPPDALGRSTMPPVTLQVSALADVRTIVIEVLPGGSDRLPPESVNVLASAIARAGGHLSEGHDDGRLTIELYGSAASADRPRG